MIIGLTGGIGSGKSTVASYFKEHDVPIINADLIARQLVAPGAPALTTIAQHFSSVSNLILPDGNLNRAVLKKIIFNDVSKREWLEALLHPLIKQEIINQYNQHMKTLSGKHAYVIAEIPLLIEANFQDTVDRILVVDSAPETQLRRVMQRDDLSSAEIEAMLNVQLDRDTRLSYADDIINNNTSLEQLKNQVNTLHQYYSKLANKTIL